MQALFKTRVELGGVDYVCGTHEVPQEHVHAAGWFFPALVTSGLIVIDDEPAEAVEVVEAVEAETADAPKRRGRPSKTQAE